MSEKRRAWTPERVNHLLSALENLGDYMSDLVKAEERVAEVLEYMKADAEKFKEIAEAVKEEDPSELVE